MGSYKCVTLNKSMVTWQPRLTAIISYVCMVKYHTGSWLACMMVGQYK